jgi:pyridoxal phosphate enzyme (YggS family)
MEQLKNIITLIQKYKTQYSNPNHIKLLAVSKGQSLDAIANLYNHGQRAFGENYLQEALEKMTALADTQIEWHYIGTIQSNKIKKIAEYFSWVQTVADNNVAKKLNAHRPSPLPPLNICLEVNISNAANKSGVAPAEVLALAQYCMTLPKLKLRGLMCIPEPHTELSQQREIFHEMFLLYKNLKQQGLALDTLSMGMSGDMEAAIAEGSTMVRIGTALFGERRR